MAIVAIVRRQQSAIVDGLYTLSVQNIVHIVSHNFTRPLGSQIVCIVHYCTEASHIASIGLNSVEVKIVDIDDCLCPSLF
eukprot:2682471-Amphidinium_carterae.1